MTFVQKVSSGGTLATLATLCRAADRAARRTGVPATVIQAGDALFVARGAKADPLKDDAVCQTITDQARGGSFWLGHYAGYGYWTANLTRIAGCALGFVPAVMAGANIALGFEPGVPFAREMITMVMGGLLFTFSAASIKSARDAEYELEQLTTDGTAMPQGGTYARGGSDARATGESLAS